MNLTRLVALLGVFLLATAIPYVIRPKAASARTDSPIRHEELITAGAAAAPARMNLFKVEAALQPNSPPVAVDDFYTVHASLLLTPVQNDTDPDGDAIIFDSIASNPQHGTLAYVRPGEYTYAPNAGYVGSDSFTYTIRDTQANFDTGTVSINVVNQAPVAHSDSYTVHDSLLLTPVQNDSDPDGDNIVFDSIATQPEHGTLAYVRPGEYTYAPIYGYVGSDSFTYTIRDSLSAYSTGTVSIDVVNQDPIADPNAYIIYGSRLLTPMENDSDPDGDNIIFDSIATEPEHGTLAYVRPGEYTYAPSGGYFGSDSFTYIIRDSLGAYSTGIVTLWVLGDGENDGAASCNARLGEPVNVTNGNMYLQQGDYTLPGVGAAISITRTYNSNSQRIGLFGRGWSSGYDESIGNNDSNLARFNQSDGRAVYLGRAAGSAGALLPLEKDFQGALVQNGGNGFTVTMTDGSVRQFNAAGKLVSLADRVGNQTTLTYATGGNLVSVTDPFGRVLTFTTNASGRVLSIADTMGTIATYTYGGGDQLLSVTYADNSALQFSYDGNYRLTTVTDALGNVVESHTYDGSGRAITSEKQDGVDHYTLDYVSAAETDVTDGLGRVTKYTFDKSKGRNVVTQVEGLCNCGGGSGSQVQTWTYDDHLNLTSKTDALDHTTTFTYDGNGNRLTETDATGTVTYTYNKFSEVLTRTDQLGGVTTNTYDSEGNLLTTEDALEHTTTFTNDSRGQLLTITDARGKVTNFTWDTSGRLTEVEDALNHVTTFGYDDRARVTSMTNALNETTSREYDAAGRLQKVIYPDSNFELFTYDLAGRRTKAKDPRGNETNFEYDDANRLVSVTDALLHATSFGYDLMSNRTSVTDALSRVTDYEYDDFNRLVKVTYPAATTGATRLFEAVEYDDAGNVIERTDTAGRGTAYAYDDVNRVTSTTDADNKTTSFEYDELSRTMQVKDALDQEYDFAYDALGRQTEMTRNAVSMSYGYDEVGNRTARTDYNGAITEYSYDDLNRLTTISYPDSTRATYGYDELSRLASASNENGVVGFNYDNRGRIASTTDVFDQTLNYSYDENGNRTATTLNSSAYAAYTYDAVNRLVDLSDSSEVVAKHSYDVTGELTNRAFLNGNSSAFEYDGLNRLTRLFTGEGRNDISDGRYTYDAANQITSQTQYLDGTIEYYGHDAVDRLTSGLLYGEASPDPPPSPPNGHPSVEAYSYDAVGNRTAATGVDSSSYTYGAFNRLDSTNIASYSYDNNGNLTAKTISSATTNYTWDFENRLKEVALPGGLTVSYKYDALGRRIERSTTNGDLLEFVYDGQDVIEDLDENGNVVTSYLNGLGIDDKIRQTDATNGNLYYVADHLGSTIALTDDSGSMVEGIGYDSFGNSTAVRNTRYTYTGREFDADTALYYYRARWYDQQVGRFISEDPIAFSGRDVNLYAYVYNDPLRLIDPTGLRRCNPILGAIIGGYLGANLGGGAGAVLGGVAAGSVGAAGGTLVIPGFGTAAGGIGGIAVGVGAGAFGGSAIGAGVGIAVGYRYCTGDDTCDTYPRAVPQPTPDAAPMPPPPPQNPDDNCDEQWRRAFEICESSRGRSDRRGITGGHDDLMKCARGLVSRRCGGNRVEY